MFILTLKKWKNTCSMVTNLQGTIDSFSLREASQNSSPQEIFFVKIAFTSLNVKRGRQKSLLRILQVRCR